MSEGSSVGTEVCGGWWDGGCSGGAQGEEKPTCGAKAVGVAAAAEPTAGVARLPRRVDGVPALALPRPHHEEVPACGPRGVPRGSDDVSSTASRSCPPGPRP